MRSICRSSRASSPETPTPRRRGKSRSFVRRCRRRSCSASRGFGSAATVEEGEEPPEVGTQVTTRDDRVDVPEPGVRLALAEVVGEFLPRGLLDDTRAGEREERAGLGDDDVTEAREAREDAGRGRMGHDRDEGRGGIAE